MKRSFTTLFLVLLLAVSGCAGMQENKEFTAFAVETMAITLGYELQDSFEWSDEVQQYYDSVMAGHLTLSATNTAEAYLKKNTHPIIVNRMIRLAEMSGFDVVGDSVIGIEKVDIEYLQTAFAGFKIGLELK